MPRRLGLVKYILLVNNYPIKKVALVWISFEQVHLTRGIFAGIKTSWITVVKMCSGFLIKSTIQWPFFFCSVLFSSPSTLQKCRDFPSWWFWRVEEIYWGECFWGPLSALLENQMAKEVPSASKVAGNLMLELVPPSLLIQIVILKCKMSWLRVFSSLSGSLSTVVYSLSPPCVFPGWWCCGRRQRGWLSWIILVKKYCFSEHFCCCCWRTQTFLLPFLGQQCRTTEGCCGGSLYSA